MFFALIRPVLFEKLLMQISQQQVRPPFWRKNTSSRPLLSRNLSQNERHLLLTSATPRYDCRSVLKHVSKSYDIFLT